MVLYCRRNRPTRGDLYLRGGAREFDAAQDGVANFGAQVPLRVHERDKRRQQPELFVLHVVCAGGCVGAGGAARGAGQERSLLGRVLQGTRSARPRAILCTINRARGCNEQGGEGRFLHEALAQLG